MTGTSSTSCPGRFTSPLKGLVKRPGQDVEEVPVIGVASVYTPAQNRGNGYAGIMMKLLSERVRSLYGGIGFSVLYSDIGPTFSAKNGGWHTCDAVEVSIPASVIFDDATSVELFTLQEAGNYIDNDVELLKEEFNGEVDRTTMQMIPQHSELEWANLRDKLLAKHLNLRDLEFVGEKGGSGNAWGYVLWFHDQKESSLTILRLRDPTSDVELKGLIGAALEEARKTGLGKGKIGSPRERGEGGRGFGE